MQVQEARKILGIEENVSWENVVKVRSSVSFE